MSQAAPTPSVPAPPPPPSASVTAPLPVHATTAASPANTANSTERTRRRYVALMMTPFSTKEGGVPTTCKRTPSLPVPKEASTVAVRPRLRHNSAPMNRIVRALRGTRRAAGFVGALGVIGACSGSSSSGSDGGRPLFLSVLPPASNSNAASTLNFQDQLSLDVDLRYAKPALTPASCTPPASAAHHVAPSSQACNYFKSAGLTPDTFAST